ncbi:MAG: peptidogalycan biosysnthesis protein [Candidatus Lokiarchaeota archaeon]
MYQVKIYHTISEIEKEYWDKLTENNIFMCYNGLKTFEIITDDSTSPFYITINDGGKIIAASVCYYGKKNDNIKAIDDVIFGRLRNLSKKFSLSPVVICSPRRGYGTHFLFSKKLNKNETNELQNRLIDIIEENAVKNSSSVCFLNLMDHETNLIQILNKRGYYKTMGLPLNYINVKWSSFDKYKELLKKKYPSMKRAVTWEISKNKRAGVTIKKLDNINSHEERLFDLLEMNYHKYNSDTFLLNRDYFQKIKNNFGKDSIIYVAIKEEKIIGVMVEFKKDKDAILTSVGIDHNYSKNDFTYFIMTFYEPIKDAPEYGIERIYAGNGLYKLKARRGFSTANTYIFYKPHNKLINYFVKILFSVHYLWMTHKFSFLKTDNR